MQAQKSGDRPGESAYPVKISTQPMPDGTAVMSIGVDMSKLAVPDKRYAADQAGIEADDHQIKLLFGQRKIGSSELRSLLVVSMSPDAARRLSEESRPFTTEISAFAESRHLSAQTLTKNVTEPEQTVAMVANVAFIARSDSESTIDFFHTSSQSLHALRTKQRDSLAIESVVSVDLPVAVLAMLLNELDGWCALHTEEAQKNV